MRRHLQSSPRRAGRSSVAAPHGGRSARWWAPALLVAFASHATALGDDGSSTKAITIDDAIAAVEPTMKPPKRFALLVGVGDYADERIPDLPACPRDVDALAEVLRDPNRGLFPSDHVVVLREQDVVRANVVAALDSLARRAGPDDLVVVFFSGHGAVDDKGRAYWVMHDTKVDALRSTALPELEITELLGEIRTRRLVTIIDACYSAATADVQARKSLLDLAAIYPDFKGDGRVGLVASKGDQLSMVITDRNDPGFGRSAFSFHLVEGLRGGADDEGNQDGVVELDELWSYAKDRTIETSRRQGGRQEPQLKGQLGSRFLLAIDGERLRTAAAAKKADAERRAQATAQLRRLLDDDAIDAQRFAEAERLLALAAPNAAERARIALYLDVAEGRLAPKHLAAMLDAAASQPVAEGSAQLRWPDRLASIASRFAATDAPLAIVYRLDACARLAVLGRFARAATAATAWSDAARASMRRTALLVDPFPPLIDATLVERCSLHDFADDAAMTARLAPDDASKVRAAEQRGRIVSGDAILAALGGTCIARMPGDDAGFERMLARPDDERPSFAAALRRLCAADPTIGVVAEGPWFVAKLASYAGDAPGRLFVGRVFEQLALPADDLFAREYAASTSRLAAVSIAAEPNPAIGPTWLRCTARVDFGSAPNAELAEPGWSAFVDRLAERCGEAAVRGVGVQRSDASLLLAFDLDAEAAAAWIDAHVALPGSAASKRP
jgi:uncharacterized caspase-like protein